MGSLRVCAVLVSLLIVISGCTGTDVLSQSQSAPGQDSNVNTVAASNGGCANGELSSDVRLKKLVPKAPEGLHRVEDPGPIVIASKRGIATIDPTEIQKQLIGVETADRKISAYYEDDNGDKYFLSIARWQTAEEAHIDAKNHSFLSVMAVSGKHRVAVMGNDTDLSKRLVTSVACISDEDLVKMNLTSQLTVNVSMNQSYEEKLNNTINKSPNGGTASIEKAETEVSTDSVGSTVVDVEVQGSVNNTNLRLEIQDSNGETIHTTSILEKDMQDGVGEAQMVLSMNGPAPPGKYTLKILKGIGTEVVYEKSVRVGGPDVKVQDVDIQTEKNQFNDGYSVEHLSVTLANEGEAAAKIDTIEVTANDGTAPMTFGEPLEPGSSREYSKDGMGMFLNVHEGTNQVTIVVKTLTTVIAKKTVTVRV